MASCSKDDDDVVPVNGAKVHVVVNNLQGEGRGDTPVFMFNADSPLGTNPVDAIAKVTTDGNGVVTFELDFANLGISASETTLSFAVFYLEDGRQVTGRVDIQVTKNEERYVTIDLPLT